MKLKAIIIDDEVNAREMLEWLIKTYCPSISITRLCSSGEEGLKAIQETAPDIVFLDIEMPHLNGFEMLEQLKTDPEFELIFTTAYDQYAIRAFKYSAFNYLLKPIDPDDLQDTIKKLELKRNKTSKEQLNLLIEQVKSIKPSVQRIALTTNDGLRFVNTAQILYCQAESNYTNVKLENGEKILVSKTLKDIDESLSGQAFFRIHHSYLININQMKRYLRGDGGYVIMNDDQQISISRSRKDEFFSRFEKF